MLRRKFLNNSFWISTGLLGCTKSVLEASIPSKVGGKVPFVRGKVSAGGKGLRDVVVSDGFSVVLTSMDGSYRIELVNDSKHVFVSVPSGYEFLHERNVARQYRSVKGEQFQQINFDLEALQVNDERHQFIVWADPQTMVESDVNKLMTQSVPDLTKYVKSLSAETLIHGICVGDLVFDNPLFFPRYSTAIEKCGIPFFQAIGNHDLNYKTGDDSEFKKMFGPTYYSFNRGKAHYIVLDDVFSLGGENRYNGFIAKEQLEWLKKDLSFVLKDKLVVLSLHIPTTEVGNSGELYEILDGYQVHIMSGHRHNNQNYAKGNIFEHVHGTVCGAWWAGTICQDGTPAGYGVYEVNGTDLSWHYKSVGYNRDYQIRSTVSVVNGQKVLQANIWNWDPNWKVEYMMDGNQKILMPHVSGYDPLAVSLYKGDKLPSEGTWAWIEPEKTFHLFSVQVPAGIKQVKVIATDRFGRTYESITNT